MCEPTFIERGELEPAHQRQKLLVRCGFPELAVRARSVELERVSWNSWLDNIVRRTVYSPSKPTAFTMASATALMLTSSSSPTVKIRDQKDSMEKGRYDYPREWQVQRRRIPEASIWKVSQGHMRRWIGEVVCLSLRRRKVCRSLVHVIYIIQKKK